MEVSEPVSDAVFRGIRTTQRMKEGQMTGQDMGIQEPDVAALAEIKKVSQSAERLAKGDSTEEADHVRVLAGLVHQLAEHTERLFRARTGPLVPASADPSSGVASHPAEAGPLSASPGHDRDVALEEDRSPEDPPAEPIDDRTSDTPGAMPS